jgi:hypothetical protein
MMQASRTPFTESDNCEIEKELRRAERKGRLFSSESLVNLSNWTLFDTSPYRMVAHEIRESQEGAFQSWIEKLGSFKGRVLTLWGQCENIGRAGVKSAQRLLAGFFAGYFSAFLARLGKTDGDGLLAVLHFATLAAFASAQGAMLAAAHRTFDAFLCTCSISGHLFLL